MNLKLQADKLLSKIDELSSRERIVLAVTLVAVIFGIYNFLVLDPYIKHRAQYKQQLALIAPDVERMQLAIESLIKKQSADPDVQIKSIIRQKQQQVAELDNTIKNETDRLIDPEEMPQILGYLLSRQSELKIGNVKSASGEAIYFDEKKEKPSGLFKHELSLSLEGRYGQVKAYLKKVEEMAEEIYWDNMTFETKQYPIGKLRLNVHTLSTSKELIGVY